MCSINSICDGLWVPCVGHQHSGEQRLTLTVECRPSTDTPLLLSRHSAGKLFTSPVHHVTTQLLSDNLVRAIVDPWLNIQY